MSGLDLFAWIVLIILIATLSRAMLFFPAAKKASMSRTKARAIAGGSSKGWPGMGDDALPTVRLF